MNLIGLLIASLFMQPAESQSVVPSAKELTQTAQFAVKALPPEEDSWQARTSLIRALALIGDDERAIEVAISEKESADSTLRTIYAPALALRLKDVPDEVTLRRLAKEDAHERILMLSDIAKALAEGDQPVAAEQAVRMITGHERGPLLQALHSPIVAQAYRRANDKEGEQRMIRLGISHSIKTEPVVLIFKHFDLYKRAIAIGEHEIVRALLAHASKGAPEYLSFPPLVRLDAVTLWTRLGCLYAVLGELDKAEGAFKAAREWCEQIERQAKDKSDFTNAVYQYVILSSGLRMAGYDKKANLTYQYADKLFRDGKADAATLDRRWVYQVISFNDFETLTRLFDVIEGPALRTHILTHAARVAIERGDPTAGERIAAALAEFQKVRRLSELGDGFFTPDSILVDLAEVHALGGEYETARRLFNRAARRAERLPVDSEYYLAEIMDRSAEAGLVEVAWSILPKIPTDSPEYARSIATLAVEVAKREAASPTTK